MTDSNPALWLLERKLRRGWGGYPEKNQKIGENSRNAGGDNSQKLDKEKVPIMREKS